MVFLVSMVRPKLVNTNESMRYVIYLPTCSGMYSFNCSVTNSSFSLQEKSVDTVIHKRLKRRIDWNLISGFLVFTDNLFVLLTCLPGCSDF